MDKNRRVLKVYDERESGTFFGAEIFGEMAGYGASILEGACKGGKEEGRLVPGACQLTASCRVSIAEGFHLQPNIWLNINKGGVVYGTAYTNR